MTTQPNWSSGLWLQNHRAFDTSQNIASAEGARPTAVSHRSEEIAQIGLRNRQFSFMGSLRFRPAVGFAAAAAVPCCNPPEAASGRENPSAPRPLDRP